MYCKKDQPDGIEDRDDEDSHIVIPFSRDKVPYQDFSVDELFMVVSSRHGHIFIRNELLLVQKFP